MDKSKHFETMVDQWVMQTVTGGETDFHELLRSLPGVYPATVVKSLERLDQNKKLPEFFLADVKIQISQNKCTHPESGNHMFPLPIPHPLDFEWRFSNSAADFLLTTCINLTSTGDFIALLSTPSLFQTVIEKKFPRDVVFLGDHTVVTDYLIQANKKYRIIPCNFLVDEIPAISASVVIIDPPWYDDFVYPFLWMAARICKSGGYIFISLPSEGTRPGVKEELEEILNWGKKIGLTVSDAKSARATIFFTPF